MAESCQFKFFPFNELNRPVSTHLHLELVQTYPLIYRDFTYFRGEGGGKLTKTALTSDEPHPHQRPDFRRGIPADSANASIFLSAAPIAALRSAFRMK